MEDEMNNDNSNDLNWKRANIFFERKAIVHATLVDGKFFNGRIFSVGSDFFEIHDRITGLQIVFFSELKRPLQEYIVDDGEEK